jgi:hypothetical protein
MHRIYDLLPPDTQAHYDRQARLTFSGTLVFKPNTITPPDVSFDALAELVAKPNLFSPLYRNARLPVRPFVRYGRFFPARKMKRAADALLAAFAEGFRRSSWNTGWARRKPPRFAPRWRRSARRRMARRTA